MSEKPKVSVIVPHYRDLRNLDVCLDALAAQSYPRNSFEIVVADNASPEGEEAVAAVVAGRARLIVVSEKGAGPARNGGVAAAQGEILAFIDSDCKAEPQWLAEGLAALAHHDFVGGSVGVLVGDPLRMTPAEAFERVFAFDMKTYVTRKGFAGSGNLFCSKAVFETVGGFRAKVSEDYEWSHRATGKGFRLGYADEARVGHPARRTWDELLVKWRRVNAETYALFAGRPGGRARWMLRSLLLPISALVHTPRVFASKNLNTFDQRIGACGVLYRLRFWRLGHALKLLLKDRGR